MLLMSGDWECAWSSRGYHFFHPSQSESSKWDSGLYNEWKKNIHEQGICFLNELTKIRFYLKEGIKRTLSKTICLGNLTFPILETTTIEPFGRETWDTLELAKDSRHDMSWHTWCVALCLRSKTEI